ncbi:hypothetical protein [Pedobacter sp.]
MKTNKMKLFYTVLFFLPIGHLSVKAQKLPEIQTANVIAPKAIRIDGKIQEWGDVFAADNKRTNLLYTVANDDKNLYLIIKAIKTETITKIMAGGISFTINTKGKKKENDAFIITYPLIARNNARTSVQGQNRQRLGRNNNEQTQEERDSITLAQRKAQLAAVKEIKVSGFPAIADSLISIYNEYGIKVVAKIDEQGAYVSEMAIPFSMLGLSLGEKNELAYQIKLNGRPNTGNFVSRTNVGGGGFGGGNARGSGFGGGNPNMARQDLMAATDFWGKYVIQKQ